MLNQLATVQQIATASILAAAILFVAATIELIQTWGKTAAARRAIEDGAEKSKEITGGTPEELKEYSAIDFKGSWEALASLAGALKDLDRSSRLYTLSLAFLAVAAATVGLDSIAQGIGEIGG